MSTDASIESVAAARLTQPGVIDRGPVQRHFDRLQQPMSSGNLAARLQRRAVPSEEAQGSALVWQRFATAPGSVVPETTTSSLVSTTAEPSVQRSVSTTPASTPAFVQRVLQRQHAPGVVTGAARASRATAESAVTATGALATKLQARYGVEQQQPISAASKSLPTRPQISVARKPDAPAVATIMPKESPRMLTLTPATRGITRSADAGLTVSSVRSTAPVIERTAATLTPSTPLVLQRMAAPAPASPSTPPLAYSMPSSAEVANDLTHAAQSERATGASHAPTLPQTAGADIERLAEEVERRLRSRLEIERERRGIRSWR